MRRADQPSNLSRKSGRRLDHAANAFAVAIWREPKSRAAA
jgi:hypothetical protein